MNYTLHAQWRQDTIDVNIYGGFLWNDNFNNCKNNGGYQGTYTYNNTTGSSISVTVVLTVNCAESSAQPDVATNPETLVLSHDSSGTKTYHNGHTPNGGAATTKTYTVTIPAGGNLVIEAESKQLCKCKNN